MSKTRKSYPSDASDAEWQFLIPYLTLMREDAPQIRVTVETHAVHVEDFAFVPVEAFVNGER